MADCTQRFVTATPPLRSTVALIFLCVRRATYRLRATLAFRCRPSWSPWVLGSCNANARLRRLLHISASLRHLLASLTVARKIGRLLRHTTPSDYSGAALPQTPSLRHRPASLTVARKVGRHLRHANPFGLQWRSPSAIAPVRHRPASLTVARKVGRHLRHANPFGLQWRSPSAIAPVRHLLASLTVARKVGRHLRHTRPSVYSGSHALRRGILSHRRGNFEP